jgi:CRP-like cAMP-binding protein
VQYAEAVSAIRRIPMFASLDASTQKLLAFSSSYLDFHDGEVLCREGDPTDSVYVIDEGAVEVLSERGGRTVVIGRLGRHNLVGEMGVFRQAPRFATVRAIGSVKVLKIEADTFLNAVTRNAGAALSVMRILSEKLAIMTEVFEAQTRGAGASAAPRQTEPNA